MGMPLPEGLLKRGPGAPQVFTWTGRITRQEIVSMIPVLAMDITPGELVLDMCASPGLRQLRLQNVSTIMVVFANEISNSRANTSVKRSEARI